MAFTPLLAIPMAAFGPPSNSADQAQLVYSTGVMRYLFDPAADESIEMSDVVEGLSVVGTLTARIFARVVSAQSSKSVRVDVELESQSTGDALDRDSASDFGAAVSQTVAVPDTADELFSFDVPLSGYTDGDLIRLRISRDADNAADDADDDLAIESVTLGDEA